MESLNKESIINMKCNNGESFKWAVTRALHPAIKEPASVRKTLRYQSEKYNWNNIDFPTPLEQVETFEKNNNILVDVFGYNKEKRHITSLKRTPLGEHTKKVLLLFVDNRYVIVKDVTKLLQQKTPERVRGGAYTCFNCFERFNDPLKLNQHRPLIGCFMKSVRNCDLCNRHGREICSYHRNLNWDNTAIRNMRLELHNPNRVRDMYINHEGDYYKFVIKEGVWTLSYLGNERNTRIIGVDENGEEIGVEYDILG